MWEYCFGCFGLLILGRYIVNVGRCDIWLVGLMGGIVCGKLIVVSMVCDEGIFVVDADQFVRDVVVPGMPVLVRICEIFGDGVFLVDGSLDRWVLGVMVFVDVEVRE